MAHGWQKTSLIDYPGKIASTIFLGGCNFACAFCHNPELVQCPNNQLISNQMILDYLKAKRHLYEGVCLTGGEPTLYSDLLLLIHGIRAIGLPIKLDTNGSQFETLKMLIQEQLIDYVAMDIKTAPSHYAKVLSFINVKETSTLIESIRQSIALLKQGTIDYEFRSTVYPPLFQPEIMDELGHEISGAKRYILQPFQARSVLRNEHVLAFSKEATQALKEKFSAYVQDCWIRGMD